MREHSMKTEPQIAKALFALAMAACLAMLMLPATAHAYEGDALKTGSTEVSTQADNVKIETETLWVGGGNWSMSIAWLPQNAKITKVTSSNPKVIKAWLVISEYFGNWPNLKPLKAGKSKITVKYKVGSKVKSVSATYTVKKYPNPYASILVNGKKINTKKNKYHYDVTDYTKTSATVKVKPAKGWKVLDSYMFVGGKYKTYKNGKSLKVPKGKDAYVFFAMENAKGDVIQYEVRFIVKAISR